MSDFRFNCPPSYAGFAKKIVWIILLTMVLYGAYAFFVAHPSVKPQTQNKPPLTQDKPPQITSHSQVDSRSDTERAQTTPWRSPLMASSDGPEGAFSRPSNKADPRPIGQLYVWTPHAGKRISAVGFFPKEDRIVSIGDDSSVAVWDLATGKMLHRIYGPLRSGLLADEYGGRCATKMCVALSQDHQSVLFLATDHVVEQDGLKMTYELWDLKTGKMLQSTLPSTTPPEQLQQERERVAKERIEKNYDIHGLSAAEYSSDGRYVLTTLKLSMALKQQIVVMAGPRTKIISGREYESSFLWDLKENKLRWRRPDSVSSLRDGDVIETRPYLSHTLEYRNVASLAEIPAASIKATSGAKNTVDPLPSAPEAPPAEPLLFDDNTLAFTTEHETIRVWNMGNRKQLCRFDQHWLDQPQSEKADISLSLVSPSGAYAVTADQAGTMRLWRLPSRNAGLAQEADAPPPNAKNDTLRDMAEMYLLRQTVSMTIGAKSLLLTQNERLQIDWRKIAECAKRENWRGQLINCDDPRFQAHEVESVPDGKKRHDVENQNAVVSGVGGKRNPAKVMRGGLNFGDRGLRLVDLPALSKANKALSWPLWTVGEVQFNVWFDNENDRRGLSLCPLDPGDGFSNRRPHQRPTIPIEQYALADNAMTLLFSVSRRRGLFRWDLSSATISPPKMLLPNVLSFLANSGLSVVVANDEALRLLRRGKKEWVKLLEISPASFAMSPGGKFVVAACATDGKRSTLHLWDTSSDPVSEVIYPQRSLLTRLAFSPDGQCLVAADDQGFVKLWQVNYPAAK